MGLSLIVGVCIFLWSVVCFMRSKEDKRLHWSERDNILFDGFMKAILGALVVFCIVGFCSKIYLSEKTVVTNRVNLVSVQSKDSIYGSFFLGCGTIESKHYYFFYKQIGDMMQRDKILAEDVFVKEWDKDTGVLEIRERITEESKWSILKMPQIRCIVDKVFYVPRGSVVKQFELN